MKRKIQNLFRKKTRWVPLYGSGVIIDVTFRNLFKWERVQESRRYLKSFYPLQCTHQTAIPFFDVARNRSREQQRYRYDSSAKNMYTRFNVETIRACINFLALCSCQYLRCWLSYSWASKKMGSFLRTSGRNRYRVGADGWL